QIGRSAVVDSMLAFPDARMLDSAMIRFWRAARCASRAIETAPGCGRSRRFLVIVTNALRQPGVPMLAGTNTPLPGLYPGRSLHDELDPLLDARFSSYDEAFA